MMDGENTVMQAKFVCFVLLNMIHHLAKDAEIEMCVVNSLRPLW